MSKKRRKKQGSNKKRTRYNQREPRGDKTTSRLQNSIISLLYTRQEPLLLQTITEKLFTTSITKKSISDAITALLKSHRLVGSGKKRVTLNRTLSLYEGILDKHPRGFGFVTQLVSAHSKKRFTKDPFLSQSKIGTVHHGDRILIRVVKVRQDGRPEAEFISLLERGTDTITGFFSPGPPAVVHPEDPRFPDPILLHSAKDIIVREGDAVIVKTLPSSDDARFFKGKIIEVLGSPQNVDVQMRLVIEKFKLPHIFSPEALAEAEHVQEREASEQRQDLRKIQHITIDGESAKDFDDAIAVIKTRKGFRLYVSIADVSHFVNAGTPLDKEAYQRGTSIYFPGRVIPMLPEKLSNELCSLVPHEDRYTFTAMLDFDRQGKRLQKHFSKSIIRSHNRFTYTTVKKILLDKDPVTRRHHKPFLTPLKWAAELATALFQRRAERGSIGFNIPEAEITLAPDGKIDTIRRAERNFAHQVIEEFMLAANEAVAEMFTEHATAVLYRIHEHPSPEKVKNFRDFAKSLDLHLPEYQDDPAWFGKILALVQDSPKEYVVNNLLLRSMQQARYDATNSGHFGLASDNYTHFTSPIRRYPDLLVHRKLSALLSHLKRSQPPLQHKKTDLKTSGIFLSQRERTAVSAEREMTTRLQLFFMENFIGTTFEAVISGVTDFALFVELLDVFVSGSIELTQLKDDYYLYDAKHHRLVGEITGKTFSLGMPVHVVLMSVDHKIKRINFGLSNDKAPAPAFPSSS